MKWIISIAIFAVLFGASIYFIMPAGISGEIINGIKLPKYALASPQIKEAYLFAKENPEALDGVKCYCGCMEMLHDGRIHSKGLHDCFLNPDSKDGFEIHGSQCEMCVNDALQVKSLIGDGKTKNEIKEIIDSKYAKQN